MVIANKEGDRLIRKNQNSATSLVFSEIAIGMTYCKIAATCGGKQRRRAIGLARDAHKVAEKWMWRVRLGHPQFNQMTAKAERLRFEIEALGD